MFNWLWFQLQKCENLLLFSAPYNGNMNIFGYLTIGQMNQTIWSHYGHLKMYWSWKQSLITALAWITKLQGYMAIKSHTVSSAG